jgi:hypothetical protein
MDRFFSLFGVYDVLGYLLSGLVLLRVSREVVLGFLALGMAEPEDKPAPA